MSIRMSALAICLLMSEPFSTVAQGQDTQQDVDQNTYEKFAGECKRLQDVGKECECDPNTHVCAGICDRFGGCDPNEK